MLLSKKQQSVFLSAHTTFQHAVLAGQCHSSANPKAGRSCVPGICSLMLLLASSVRVRLFIPQVQLQVECTIVLQHDAPAGCQPR